MSRYRRGSFGVVMVMCIVLGLSIVVPPVGGVVALVVVVIGFLNILTGRNPFV